MGGEPQGTGPLGEQRVERQRRRVDAVRGEHRPQRPGRLAERLRAQVFTTGASVKITAFALGAAVAGPLAEGSLPGALLAAAGVQLSAAAAYPLVGARRSGRASGGGGAQ
ncbi:hypothetical protein GCM10017752_02210 [Streptomyces roseoviridis]